MVASNAPISARWSGYTSQAGPTPTGIATGVVQTDHCAQDSTGVKSDEEIEKDLMCSDEEFSDESSGSEELKQGL